MSTVITLEEYKLYKGINNPNQDEKLEPLIESCNSIVSTYCGLDFSYNSDYSVVLSNRSNIILLPHAPVIEVTNLTVFSSGTVISPSQYMLDKDAGMITVIDPTVVMPRTPYGLRADVVHGVEATPHDIKLAAIELVTYYDKREFNKSQDIGNGQSVDFVSDAILPPQIKSVLDLHRVL